MKENIYHIMYLLIYPVTAKFMNDLKKKRKTKILSLFILEISKKLFFVFQYKFNCAIKRQQGRIIHRSGKENKIIYKINEDEKGLIDRTRFYMESKSTF